MIVLPAPPLPRRRLLAAAGAGLAAAMHAGAGHAALPVQLLSPPGSLGALPDYPHWVAAKLGYFGGLGPVLAPGPPEAMAALRQVDRGLYDLAAAPPALLALALEQGMRLVSVFQLGGADPWALAFRKGEAAAGLRGLAGKTVLLDHAVRQPWCEAWLAQAGVEAGAVSYLEAGAGWAQALAAGRGDAAFTWDGLRAQWSATGLAFDYLPGRTVSRFPGTAIVASAVHAANPAARGPLVLYLRGWAMGLAFAARNPRAAAQIAAEQGAASLSPAVATAALLQLAAGYRGDMDQRQGWGWHALDGWALLLRTLAGLGQLSLVPPAATVASNGLIADANAFDAAQVTADADGYVLAADFAAVDIGALRTAP